MAETLGSLVDKLSIKQIRSMVLRKMLKRAGHKRGKEMWSMLDLLARQTRTIRAEVDAYLAAATAGRIPLREEKLKLYNKRGQINRIRNLSSVGEAVGELARKNLELWGLEDEARRKGILLSEVGRIKRKIDAANQQRNDLIDKVDELLVQRLSEKLRG